ncbi:MAG: hypothetical protein ACRC57_12935 [Sarcina sp.]
MIKLENLSLRDNIIINGKKYAINSKIKLSDIDNNKEILRYELKNYEDSIKIVDIDLSIKKYQLLTNFRPDSFFSEEEITQKSESKIKCRLMILDCFGTARYSVADVILLKEYKAEDKLTVIEESRDKKIYYTGIHGNILDIKVQRQEREENINNIKMVDNIIKENILAKKLPIILVAIIVILLLFVAMIV